MNTFEKDVIRILVKNDLQSKALKRFTRFNGSREKYFYRKINGEEFCDRVYRLRCEDFYGDYENGVFDTSIKNGVLNFLSPAKLRKLLGFPSKVLSDDILF